MMVHVCIEGRVQQMGVAEMGAKCATLPVKVAQGGPLQ